MGRSALMRQKRQREVWGALGQADADWAVLTVRDRREGGWADELDAFYASGVAVVEECLALAEPAGFDKALDYGAGTGRLSFALATRFTNVTAVDVSDGMLRTLRERAKQKGLDNISPVQVDALRPASDHDFALSLLVLQHLPTKAAVEAAVGLVAAALRPGGVAVLEVPERALLLRARIQPRLRVYSLLRTVGVAPDRLHRLGFSGISMLTIDEADARRMLDRCGFDVLRREPRPDRDYDYVRWVVRRHA
jgi:SAM-dependent methyltransferase